MRRTLTLSIALFLTVCAPLPAVAGARAHGDPDAAAGLSSAEPLSGTFGLAWREERCRYATADGRPGFTRREVRRVIECAVGRWPVPGGLSTALCYAEHESGLNPYADNPSSSAAGVFQTVSGTWASIHGSHDALRRRWDLRDAPGYLGVYNARTHVVLVIRWVHRAGWGAWSNYASYSC